MKKLIHSFQCPRVKKIAAKIIKIQIKYTNRAWRKNNMKVLSLVFHNVPLKNLDDWLAMEGQQAAGFQSSDDPDLIMTQDEIRHLY